MASAKLMLAPLFLAVAWANAGALEPRFVNAFDVKKAAVVAIASQAFGTTPADTELLITTFAAFGKTPVYRASGIAAALAGNASAVDVQQFEDVTAWTNYVAETPVGVFSKPNVITTAGGFLVPTKTTGTIDLFEVSKSQAPTHARVSVDKKGWFYHKVVWDDLNDDGRMDILAARATAPTNGKPKQGELVWLEQPASGALDNNTHWAESVIVSGPDVDFIYEDINDDGRNEIIAAQFFSAPVLAVYTCDADSWSHCHSNNINVTIIDDSDGPFFNVKRADLNGDGRKDLLVSNNRGDGTGAIFAYEQPANYMSDPWTKHTITTGMRPRPTLLPQPGRGAPGSISAFFPTVDPEDEERPWLLLSGDDGGFFSVFKPSDAEWGYKEIYLCNSSNTVGSPAIGDVNRDGVMDLFLPFYADGKVEIFTFVAPETPNPRPPPTPELMQKCVQCLSKTDPLGNADSTWCPSNNQCHLTGSPLNPCKSTECVSHAGASQCRCTACNDPACWHK